MKHIKKQDLPIWIPIFLCITLTVSIALLLSLSWESATTPKNGEQKPVYIYLSQEDPAASTDTEEVLGWILRAHQERIGIFREDGVLEQVLDIQIKTLPKADQFLLEEGIYAKDRDTLESLIEDYSE